jgi:hypothetical protein
MAAERNPIENTIRKQQSVAVMPPEPAAPAELEQRSCSVSLTGSIPIDPDKTGAV